MRRVMCAAWEWTSGTTNTTTMTGIFTDDIGRYLEKQFCIPPRVVALQGVDIRNFAGAPLAREKQLIILPTIYHINIYIIQIYTHTTTSYNIIYSVRSTTTITTSTAAIYSLYNTFSTHIIRRYIYIYIIHTLHDPFGEYYII